MSAEGEVEKKVRELQEKIFEEYNPGLTILDEDGRPCISKEDLKEFIKKIMTDALEMDAWDDEDFETGYN